MLSNSRTDRWGQNPDRVKAPQAYLVKKDSDFKKRFLVKKNSSEKKKFLK